MWKSNSALWEAINQAEGNIPKCEDVTLPYQFEKEETSNGGPPQIMTSPLMHPALRRIASEKSAVIPRKGEPCSNLAYPSFLCVMFSLCTWHGNCLACTNCFVHDLT